MVILYVCHIGGSEAERGGLGKRSGHDSLSLVCHAEYQSYVRSIFGMVQTLSDLVMSRLLGAI